MKETALSPMRFVLRYCFFELIHNLVDNMHYKQKIFHVNCRSAVFSNITEDRDSKFQFQLLSYPGIVSITWKGEKSKIVGFLSTSMFHLFCCFTSSGIIKTHIP